jgi:hypothetical protein
VGFYFYYKKGRKKMKTMDEITIPETTITDEQYAYNARQLIMTVIYRAAEEYCAIDSDSRRNAILKDLRSSYMNDISDGMSVLVAEQLELHPEEIAERMRRNHENPGMEEV